MHFVCIGVTYKLGVCSWHERKIKTHMVAKGISQDDFPENGVGRRSNISFRMRTMTVSGSSPTHSPRRVVPSFYRNSVVYFREQQVLF